MTTTTANAEVSATILERIQKLLALQESPNVNEAAAAAAKVQELLDTYNLEMAQVMEHNASVVNPAAFDTTEVKHTYGPKTSAVNKGWQWLMSMVARQNNCKILLTRGWEEVTADTKMGKKTKTVNFDGKPHREVARFIIIGSKTNVDATISLFDWLRINLEVEAAKAWPTYKREMADRGRKPGDPIPFRVNFIDGASREFDRIMTDKRKERENYQQVTALAVNYQAANANYLAEKYPKLGKGSTSKAQMNHNAYAMGKAAGAKLEQQRTRSVGSGSGQKALS